MLNTRTFHIAILIIIVFACYFNVLGGAFLWDDSSLVVNNELIRDIRHIPKMFAFDAWPTEFASFYRPIQLVTYGIDYAFWKLNPVGYHITNSLIHCGVVVLLYFLLAMFFCNRRNALLCSLIFAVHPIHTEAVSYISGRADILAALCMLFFVLYYSQLIKD